MTLCIAAIAWKEKAIVTVSDQMLSTGEMSTEPASMKFGAVGRDEEWVYLYAGDPTAAASIIQRVTSALAGKKETVQSVASIFVNSFKKELQSKIEDEQLSRFGLTRKQFVSKGRAIFGDIEFKRRVDLMDDAELETDFVVGGFDKDGPTLFSVKDPGVRCFHKMIGFHAIGMGDTLAHASLMSNFDMEAPLEDVVYRLAEAKFRGESAFGVGKKTTFTIHKKGRPSYFISSDEVKLIRELWEAKGKPPVPPEAKSLITPLLTKTAFGSKRWEKHAKTALK